ncbi:hypothetical protein [Pleionea sp. CnH1-48]|uniref:hypothetical protein n=1 Tax=Pleionea sp. CnH1-48 TaxID=2954494 RepID=UPI0020975B28|nr:hypothetical protein [Pleionea sp. CnH1-48]MCO7225233.1 hypothetical protein [Pleionea sp. CnH1-48]
MKALICILVISLSTTYVSAHDRDSISRHDFYKLEEKIDKLLRQNQKLINRVAQLEGEVEKMSSDLIKLSHDRPSRYHPPKEEFVCTVSTMSKGTFIGKATKKIEARAKAIQKCEKAGGRSQCQMNRPVCE